MHIGQLKTVTGHHYGELAVATNFRRVIVAVSVRLSVCLSLPLSVCVRACVCVSEYVNVVSK